jgi:GNAT superfamily N-acetyltransferase
MASEITIRALALSEMRIPLDWAAAEGWNPGLHDAAPFHAADPEGFLAAFVDGEVDGPPAACISVVRSGAAFGFLGFYICRPDMRGKGIGWSLWQAGIARLAGRTIGLDGVLAQQDNYRKSGFVLAHRNMRFQGPAAAVAATDPAILPITPELEDRIIAYDRRFYPAERTAFLRLWLRPPDGAALACVERGEVRGYGVIRRCRAGHKIGPLFAETPAIAERLFVALTATLPPNGEVTLDLPEPNSEALSMARRFGLQPVFETARMYAGPAPDLPLAGIYGITSFELG